MPTPDPLLLTAQLAKDGCEWRLVAWVALAALSVVVMVDTRLWIICGCLLAFSLVSTVKSAYWLQRTTIVLRKMQRANT